MLLAKVLLKNGKARVKQYIRLLKSLAYQSLVIQTARLVIRKKLILENIPAEMTLRERGFFF
ncbi:MAG: hypothetical protein QG603_342, partial [Patescibacteria group bacterium]|nr:hypothetical protein [Patescibacteria group bacterium]